MTTWPHRYDRLTIADVLADGACMEGALEWVEEHGGRIAGDVRRFGNDPDIRAWARLNGNGSGVVGGYGYGYHDGYGSGDGYGYGDGNGDGDGYGGGGDGYDI